jgi:hypothetical protein
VSLGAFAPWRENFLMLGGTAMASQKQRRAAQTNIKKAAKAAKRKQTLKRLPKKTRRALGKQAAKVRKSRK